MTAVATPVDEEQLVAQPRKFVTFYARRQNLRLVLKPRRPERSPMTGEVIGETTGLSIQFDVFIDPIKREQLVAAGTDEREAQAVSRIGRYECPTEGEATLENGRTLDAADLLDALRRHRLNGDLLEGFWETQPTVPPVTRAELDRITAAALEWDVDTLRAIVEQESAGWGREDIIRIAEGAIEKILERDAQVEAAQQAEHRARMEEQDRAAKALADAESRARDAEKRAADAERAAKAAAAKPAPKPKPAAKPAASGD
jgi:hypothetical protein